MSTWYISRNGNQFGPYSEEQLKEFTLNKKISERDYVWKEGWQKWEQFCDCKDFIFPNNDLSGTETNSFNNNKNFIHQWNYSKLFQYFRQLNNLTLVIGSATIAAVIAGIALFYISKTDVFFYEDFALIAQTKVEDTFNKHQVCFLISNAPVEDSNTKVRLRINRFGDSNKDPRLAYYNFLRDSGFISYVLKGLGQASMYEANIALTINITDKGKLSLSDDRRSICLKPYLAEIHSVSKPSAESGNRRLTVKYDALPQYEYLKTDYIKVLKTTGLIHPEKLNSRSLIISENVDGWAIAPDTLGFNFQPSTKKQIGTSSKNESTFFSYLSGFWRNKINMPDCDNVSSTACIITQLDLSQIRSNTELFKDIQKFKKVFEIRDEANTANLIPNSNSDISNRFVSRTLKFLGKFNLSESFDGSLSAGYRKGINKDAENFIYKLLESCRNLGSVLSCYQMLTNKIDIGSKIKTFLHESRFRFFCKGKTDVQCEKKLHATITKNVLSSYINYLVFYDRIPDVEEGYRALKINSTDINSHNNLVFVFKDAFSLLGTREDSIWHTTKWSKKFIKEYSNYNSQLIFKGIAGIMDFNINPVNSLHILREAGHSHQKWIEEIIKNHNKLIGNIEYICQKLRTNIGGEKASEIIKDLTLASEKINLKNGKFADSKSSYYKESCLDVDTAINEVRSILIGKKGHAKIGRPFDRLEKFHSLRYKEYVTTETIYSALKLTEDLLIQSLKNKSLYSIEHAVDLILWRAYIAGELEQFSFYGHINKKYWPLVDQIQNGALIIKAINNGDFSKADKLFKTGEGQQLRKFIEGDCGNIKKGSFGSVLGCFNSNSLSYILDKSRILEYANKTKLKEVGAKILYNHFSQSLVTANSIRGLGF